jgi:hypothetical protein
MVTMRKLILLSLITSATPAFAQSDLVEPHPRHVWEYDRSSKTIRYGTPETDDLVLSIACEKRGRIVMNLPLDSKAVDRKTIMQPAKGKEVGFKLKAPGKVVTLSGTPRPVTFGDDPGGWWEIDSRMSVNDQAFNNLIEFSGSSSRARIKARLGF